jgi:hypothetical protein
MSSSDTSESKRKSSDMTISPHKASKKLKALSDGEADAILEGEVFKGIL